MATKRLFLSCMVLMALTGAGTALRGQAAGFAYVANCGIGCTGPGDARSSVSAYSIDGTTGALTEIAGSPFPAGSSPFSVTVDPTGRFAYVTNIDSNNPSAYSIDRTTGALAPVAGSPFPAEFGPFSVTVDPAGQFAYVANCGSGGSCVGGVRPGNVSAYTIDGTTGALTPVAGSPFPVGGNASSVTVDPTGQFVYVVDGQRGGVSAYSIDRATGVLTPVPGSPFPTGLGALSVTVGPTGQFAYVANCRCARFLSGPGNVSAYTIDGITGALMPVAGSPFPAGTAPRSVTTTAGPRPPADLAVSKETESNRVESGANLTYGIAVQNLGPGAASGVVVTDLLPSGTSLVGAFFAKNSCAVVNGEVTCTTSTPTLCEFSNGTVRCAIGDLANFSFMNPAWVAVELVVQVTVPAGSTITNTARVKAANPDPNPSNNSATITTLVN